jgi:hypothetical protein
MLRVLKIVPVLVAAFVAACFDLTATSPDIPGLGKGARLNVVTRSCDVLSDSQTRDLITVVYTSLRQQTGNQGLAFWDRIQAAGTSAEKIAITWEFVDDILTLKQSIGAASSPDIVRLINYLFCNVGVAAGFPGGDGWVVRPGENLAQLPLINSTRYAGFVLPANTVNANTGPRLFAISPSTATLNTPLDQYGTAQEFSAYPTASFPAGIYVGLCAGASNASVEARIKLGHNQSTGAFEVLPPPPASVSFNDLLTCLIGTNSASSTVGCETYYQASSGRSMVDRLWAMMLPKVARAATMLSVGCPGIGGTLTELSPVRPVDPQVAVIANATGTSAIFGFPVFGSPSVTVRTPKGTVLAGVPVTFGVVSGGGAVIPTTPIATGSNGVAAANFWTVNTVASTSVLRATPAIGGQAVTGAVFNPSFVEFRASSTSSRNGTNPATQLAFTTQPAANTNYTAGAAASFTVTVRTSSGATAANYNGPVRFTSSTGSLGGATVVKAANGVATASLILQKVQNQQFITATGAYNGATFSSNSNLINVTAAQTSSARIVRADAGALTAATGSGLSSSPKVRVEDAFGNLITNRTVYFFSGNNGSTVTPTTGLSTGSTATGVGPTQWPIAFGRNTLVASLNTSPSSTVGSWIEIPATGTPTASSGDVYRACEPSGTTYDPINTYAPRWFGLTATDRQQKLTNVKVFLNNPGSPIRIRFRMRVILVVSATSSSELLSTDSWVVFNGATSEQKEVNFATADIPLTGATQVVFRIEQLDNISTKRPVRFVSSIVPKSDCAFNTVAWASPAGTPFRSTAAMRVVTKQ